MFEIRGEFWVKQPWQAMPINRGNPLGAKVLTHLPLTPYVKRGSRPSEVVTLSGTGAYEASSRGLAIKGIGAGAGSVPLNLSAETSITLAVSFYWNAYANDDALLMEFTPNVNTNAGSLIIDPNAASGAFSVGVKPEAAPEYSTYTIVRPTAARWHRLLVPWNLALAQATTAVYLNGIAQTLTPFATGYPGSAATFANNTLYILSRANASLFATGKVQDLTIFRGCLSPAEALSEARNPYQILWGRPRRQIVASRFPSAGPTLAWLVA